jgi:choline dehydrogenase-like flavoprotein
VALGSIKTPVILQQSGIGPQAVLQAAGVTQRVNLPIGQNLIDQVTTTTDFSFSAASGGGQGILFPRFSVSLIISFLVNVLLLTLQDVFTGSDATRAANLLNNNLESYVQDAINNGAATSANGLRTVLQLQRDWILNKGVGISENYDYSYGSTLGYDSWYLLPFGRGSVKITSNNPYSGSSFTIDPRFFANEFDSLASGATARFTRRLSTTAPLSSIVTGETRPGSGGVTDTLDGWTAWTKSNYRSNWHPIGTVSMMSRDLGGCVDSRHRVVSCAGFEPTDTTVRRQRPARRRRLQPPVPGLVAPHVGAVRPRRTRLGPHQGGQLGHDPDLELEQQHSLA